MTHKTTPKQVVMYQSLDGSLHRTAHAAQMADSVYAQLVNAKGSEADSNRTKLALEAISLEFDWYMSGRQLMVGGQVVPLKSICEWIHSYGHRIDDIVRMGAYYATKTE